MCHEGTCTQRGRKHADTMNRQGASKGEKKRTGKRTDAQRHMKWVREAATDQKTKNAMMYHATNATSELSSCAYVLQQKTKT